MMRPDGYVQIHRCTLEHVAVAERALGRTLPKGAIVHHVNGDRADNRPENLVICPSHAYHMLIHKRERALDACGNPDWLRCAYCFQYDDPANLYVRGRHSRHRSCFNLAWNARSRARRQAHAQ